MPNSTLATVAESKKESFLAPLNKDNSVMGNYIALQAEASTALDQLSFPTTKTEAWKYTRVGKVLNKSWQQQSGTIDDITPFLIEGLDAYHLTFVNGQFDASNSTLPEGANFTVSPLSQANHSSVETFVGKYADHQNDIFTALNTVYATDGVFIHVPTNVVAEKTIHIININTGSQSVAIQRNVIIAEKSSAVKVVHSFHSIGNAETLTNSVTEILVDENANVVYDKIQVEEEQSFHINTEQVQQHSNSNFTINTVTLNGGLVRNGLNIVVQGTNCESNLYGLYLLKNEQHVDNHTMVDHKEPHCNSNELYKGIMDDKSTGVFNGKVFVRQDAQKINAFQSNANILMTDQATINSKPELEIYADDVKCSHGSTTGQFDEEAVFYLRARGISEDKARRLLMAAFAGDVLDNIKSEPVRQKIDELLEQRFAWTF